MKHYKTVLFDLDGTLLDTSKGILGAVKYAQQQMNLPSLPDSRLREFIGPPPVESYKRIFGVDEAIAQQAAFFHRKYGSERGLFEAQHYPGISELLQNLKNSGRFLGVATLKREDTAQKILAHFNLKQYFDVIAGIDTKEQLSKSDIIQAALKEMGQTNASAVLIGDSQYDAEGAEKAGVSFIGVTYGFGFSDAKDISPYASADSPSQLLALL
ncbi:phosphoglycolate phosphatase [Hydrogeniiclostridium mannosilyticum]|uniref:Phosphoglycolate phosphatase n=1 Tax=Hydrogeniiclostridium mannosilyticum TaxID=2764322 RepID=A0A328UKJ2_9FIRM|nr:HAD hydrolase-like protein [Hydrogeniiclostridium mannosilyticum]RAQ30484.1 phosphoglycolate phosphatase [Hydrogeniiclostridium mannosilyticum]